VFLCPSLTSLGDVIGRVFEIIPDIDAVLIMLPFALIGASLCRITVHLAYELRDTLINVNSADPGFDRYGSKTATAARRPSPKAPRKSSASRCCPTSTPPAPTPTWKGFRSRYQARWLIGRLPW
jgi:hypothetical protein